MNERLEHVVRNIHKFVEYLAARSEMSYNATNPIHFDTQLLTSILNTMDGFFLTLGDDDMVTV